MKLFRYPFFWYTTPRLWVTGSATFWEKAVVSSLVLFNHFINDIVEYIDVKEIHTTVTEELNTPRLSYANDLATASLTSY
jgi:hypothetical protein